MTDVLAGTIWWWWLAAVAASFAVMEGAAVIWAHSTGQRDIGEWTLSDAIRRWKKGFRWLGPIVVGVAAMLCVHWFGMDNP
jgi:hypothetical protein